MRQLNTNLAGVFKAKMSVQLVFYRVGFPNEDTENYTLKV
jgi:hypothetical protein